jgi:hypothetical protein
VVAAESLDEQSRRNLLVHPLTPPLTATLALIWQRKRPLDEAGVIVRAAIAQLVKRGDGKKSRRKSS